MEVAISLLGVVLSHGLVTDTSPVLSGGVVRSSSLAVGIGSTSVGASSIVVSENVSGSLM